MRGVLQDLVDQAEVLGLRGTHELVTLHVGLDEGQVAAGVLDVDLVQLPLDLDDLLGVDLDVGGLAVGAARGLMDHDPGIGEGVSHPGRARGQEQAAHRASLSDAPSRYRRQDVSENRLWF